ncbi:hypothetical protein GCM10023260_07710 [Bartonella acomydis]|uniref:Autotransporter domain-containing protein n=1 Tax=Bartonella acomydis TaxID=686234 RepID=A0ABP9MJF8_9HYPH
MLSTEKAIATIINSTIHTESVAFSVSKGGRIHAKGIDANSIYKGLETKNGIINIEDSTITVQRGGAGGIVFYETPKHEVKEGENIINKISLTKSKLLVKDGVGIRGPYGSKSVAEISLKDSEIRADVLLRNKTKRKYYDNDTLPVSLTLAADNSILEGRARTLKINTTTLSLMNNSKWYLKVSQEDSDTDFNTFNFDLSDLKQRALSTVSVLSLNNSSIIFNAPSANVTTALGKDQYQILSVGRTAEVYKSRDNMVSTVETVYNATGDARIYFNTEWSNGLEKEQQKTDRLLIHGNVSGTTTIYFNNLSNNGELESEDSLNLNTRGLSLIQVSGEANETSFKLANGYVTMAGLPYKYTLNAYGPTSSRGKAESTQSLLGSVSQESEENTLKDYTSYVINGNALEGVSRNEEDKPASNGREVESAQNHLSQNENFWDFRLHKELLGSDSTVEALVPQMASYLVLPRALFYSGLTDMAKQNALLANIRTSVVKKGQEKQDGFFLYTYGSTGTLSSARGPLEYSYGARLRYAALQGGVNITASEGQNTTTHFGLVGTYGQISFTPKDMQDAGKSTVDKWSLTAYGTVQHDNGFYLDALLSYNILNGNITNALIGKTAKLKNAKMLTISTTVGKQFATGIQDVTFDPQAQIAYQHLMFDTISDADNFSVNMNNPYQGLIRVGGRLTKTVVSNENGHAVSFYGKVNAIKTLGDDQAIHIDKDYKIDPMGSFLEGGLGISAQLSQNLSLHGDVSYQQKLQKTGISGASFSGGIRYQF